MNYTPMNILFHVVSNVFLFMVVASCAPSVVEYYEEYGKSSTTSYLITNWERMDSISDIQFDKCAGEYGSLRIIPSTTELTQSVYREQWDDNHWNKYNLPGSKKVLVNSFTSISVISSADYNGVVAGDDLRNKFELLSMSPYLWLSNGITIDFDWVSYEGWEASIKEIYNISGNSESYMRWSHFYPVRKNLEELVPEDLLLLNPKFIYLCIIEPPTDKNQRLTITFSDEAKEYSSVIGLD